MDKDEIAASREDDNYDLATRMADAADRLDWRLGQVQGFGNKGKLWIRDCWLKPADQLIWTMSYTGEEGGKEYGLAQEKMMRRIGIERYWILLNEATSQPAEGSES